MLTKERLAQIHAYDSCFPFLVNEKNELVQGYLAYLDMDTALAQASAFAQYVSDHAKGEMVKAAQRFLSTEGAAYIEKRVNVARKVYEGEINPDMLEAVRNRVYEKLGMHVDDDVLRCAIGETYRGLRDGL